MYTTYPYYTKQPLTFLNVCPSHSGSLLQVPIYIDRKFALCGRYAFDSENCSPQCKHFAGFDSHRSMLGLLISRCAVTAALIYKT